MEEELPVGNVTYGLTLGILRICPTLNYNSDTILASKRIFNPFMGPAYVFFPDVMLSIESIIGLMAS